MEELQVIETTSGRQFKPWASREDVQAIKQETVQAVVQAVQDPASITAITSEIAGGKQAIASAINAKGGSASAAESFAELAEAVAEIPNLDYMARLAGIIAGGNYNKNALEGHNENVKYGKTEIVDNVGAFETININRLFQNWDLLERVEFPFLTDINALDIFRETSSLKGTLFFPELTTVISGTFRSMRISHFLAPKCEIFDGSGYMIFDGVPLISFECGTLTVFSSVFVFNNSKSLRSVKIGQDTNINIDLSAWGANNVIAEGQSGIDDLNSNLYNNLLTKLYDHSNDGQTRTLRIGWLSRVTADNIAYANAKGWTLTT